MSNTNRLFLFFSSAAIAVVVAFVPISDLVRNGRPPEYYTHIPLIPLISAYVLFKRRKNLLKEGSALHLPGLSLMILAFGLCLLDVFRHPELISHAQLRIGAAILLLYGSFFAFFGARSFARAFFPFMFLVFMIPLPLSWMDNIVSLLASASAGLTNLLFLTLRVPFVQEGSLFRLPGFDLKVAQECSGIRSSLALLITSVLAAQIFLNRRWKKIALVVAVLPVTVFKNAVRIVALYLLSYFVDMKIIEGGFLHRSGGFIFFGLGLVMLAYVLWILRSPREALAKAMGAPFAANKKGLTKG